MKNWIMVAVILAAFVLGASSQSSDNIQPYVIGSWNSYDTPGYQISVKKMVYQGCELFVVVGGQKDTVGITTGRGCK